MYLVQLFFLTGTGLSFTFTADQGLESCGPLSHFLEVLDRTFHFQCLELSKDPFSFVGHR